MRVDFRVGLKISLVAALAAWLAGCAGILQQNTEPEPREDPLLERIVRADGSEAEFADLLEAMSQQDVVYLGETHDNARHHAIQKEILEALVARGLKPALGFEFFDVGQTGVLEQYVNGKATEMRLHSSDSDAPSAEERLRKALGWQDTSDEHWNYYFQLLEVARREGLPVFGADLPAGIRKRISRSGIEALNPVEAHQLSSIPPQPLGYRPLMYEKFRQGHCGWGEEGLLDRLYQTWTARNARMAESLVQMASGSEARPLVMILGNGHTQYDEAVVGDVRRLNPSLRQLNLALQPIAIEPQPLADYLAPTSMDGQDFGPRHQWFWFTQRSSYLDPCASLNAPE